MDEDTADPASQEPRRVMPSADLFCADNRYLHLEQNWRQGLGWWLVDRRRRSRLTVAEAIRAVPLALAHEVLLEVELLLPAELRANDGASREAGFERALAGLTEEVVAARTACKHEPRIVGAHASDRLVE